ncbi:MAG TPA: type II secretion system protein F [Porticoccaceae bacterium]|jgi:type IV pilus assembly protein PilC|nr:type II secretion system protein F [Porticoccaceae bacterium]
MSENTNPTFVYHGFDRKLESINGNMQAENINIARAQIQALGISVESIKAKPIFNFNLITRKQLTADELMIFSRQLSTMLKANLSLIHALDVAALSAEKPHIKQFVLSLKSELAAGNSFSATLKNRPEVFNDLYCNLISAGETTGNLDTILDRIATSQEKTQQLKSSVKKALTYPITVLIVACIVVSVLLIKIVPSFESTFNGMGAELPQFTQLVVRLSELAQSNGLLVVALTGLIMTLFSVAFKKSQRVTYYVDKLALHVPIIGKILLLAAVSRFARTLATTYGSGIPMLGALEASGKAAGNRYIIKAIEDVASNVSQGSLLGNALHENGNFPPLLIQLAKVGEEAGELEEMINKAAETYERSVDDAVSAMTSALEPITMSFVAVVIGGVMVAMYLPIFKLGSVL